MPIYEYRCSDCGERFSKFRGVGAGDDGVRCPACSGGVIERQISAFASQPSTNPGQPSSTGGSSCGGFT